MKDLKITAPEGYIVDQENSTFDWIKYKKVEVELPKSWEELEKVQGAYVSGDKIETIGNVPVDNTMKDIFPSVELAQASLALAQLLQLRDRYRDGWKPDWDNNDYNYCIYIDGNWETMDNSGVPDCFSFQSSKIRDKFLKNFRDNLLEEVKPLFNS